MEKQLYNWKRYNRRKKQKSTHERNDRFPKQKNGDIVFNHDKLFKALLEWGIINNKNNIMTFTGIELSALVKLGLAMAEADGHVDNVEQAAIASELSAFGIDGSNAPTIIAGAAVMDAAVAIGTLAAMNNVQKKYACGYLAAIMAVDGDIAASEVKLWQLICTLASFPTMTISEALTFWTSN